MAFAPSPCCRFQIEIDKFWVVTAITDKEQEVAHGDCADKLEIVQVLKLIRNLCLIADIQQ
jgi:hypothetical protein